MNQKKYTNLIIFKSMRHGQVKCVLWSSHHEWDSIPQLVTMGILRFIHPVFWLGMTIPWWPSSHSGRPEFCSRSMLSSVRNKPARVGTAPQGQGSARVFQFHKNEGY